MTYFKWHFFLSLTMAHQVLQASLWPSCAEDLPPPRVLLHDHEHPCGLGTARGKGTSHFPPTWLPSWPLMSRDPLRTAKQWGCGQHQGQAA